MTSMPPHMITPPHPPSGSGAAPPPNNPPPSGVIVLEFSLPQPKLSLFAWQVEDIRATVEHFCGKAPPASAFRVISVAPPQWTEGRQELAWTSPVPPHSPLLKGFDFKRFSPLMVLISHLTDEHLRTLQQGLPSIDFPQLPGAPRLRLIATPWSMGRHWEEVLASTVCTASANDVAHHNTASAPPPPNTYLPPNASGSAAPYPYPAPREGAPHAGGPVRPGRYRGRTHSYEPPRAHVGNAPYTPPTNPSRGSRMGSATRKESGWGGAAETAPHPRQVGPTHPVPRVSDLTNNPAHTSMVRFELINLFFLEDKGFNVMEAIVGKNSVHVNYILSKAEGQVDLRVKGYISDKAPVCDRVHLELKGTTPEVTYAASDHVSDLLTSVRGQLYEFARNRHIPTPNEVGFREHRYKALFDDWNGQSSGKPREWKYLK